MSFSSTYKGLRFKLQRPQGGFLGSRKIVTIAADEGAGVTAM